MARSRTLVQIVVVGATVPWLLPVIALLGPVVDLTGRRLRLDVRQSAEKGHD